MLAPLAVTFVLFAGPAEAPRPALPLDTLPLDLAWRVPESCPDADYERAEIRRRVGIMDRTFVSEVLFADVEIRATTPGTLLLSLRTRLGDKTGEREIAGRDCQQLADAAALVLALLINPTASLGATVPSPAPVPPALAVPTVPAAADFATTARFAVGIEGIVALGVLPGVSEGLAGRLFFQHGPFALSLAGRGFFPKDQGTTTLPVARASFYLLESALAGCVRTSPTNRLGAMLCLGGTVLRLHGESSGVSKPGDATAYWAEALAEVTGHVRVTRRTRLRISAEAQGLGSRPDFAILGLGSVYRSDAVSLRVALGADMLF